MPAGILNIPAVYGVFSRSLTRGERDFNNRLLFENNLIG